jgi:hypothetical protein
MLSESIDEIGGDTLWPFWGEIDILELNGTTDNAEVEGNCIMLINLAITQSQDMMGIN